MTPTPSPGATTPLQPATIAAAHPYSAAAHALAPTHARRLTVGSMPAPWPAYTPRPDPLPYLRLRGRWLAAAGFAVGAQIRVQVAPGRLLLEVIDDMRPASPLAPAGVHVPETSPMTPEHAHSPAATFSVHEPSGIRPQATTTEQTDSAPTEASCLV